MVPDFPPLPPVDWGNIEAPLMEGHPTEASGDEDAPNSSDVVRPPPQEPIRDLQEDGTGGPSESRDFEAAPDFLEEGYWDEMNYEGIGWYADAASRFEDRGSLTNKHCKTSQSSLQPSNRTRRLLFLEVWPMRMSLGVPFSWRGSRQSPRSRNRFGRCLGRCPIRGG